MIHFSKIFFSILETLVACFVVAALTFDSPASHDDGWLFFIFTPASPFYGPHGSSDSMEACISNQVSSSAVHNHTLVSFGTGCREEHSRYKVPSTQAVRKKKIIQFSAAYKIS